MRYQPLPVVGGSYADESRPWSQQDTVNWLPCAAEVSGARSDSMLKTPPGLKPFLEIPDQSQVRATHNAEGKLFAVIGKTLYNIKSDAIAIPIGTVPGIGRVGMSHNQISLGNEVVAVNGGAGYVYNTVTGDFQRITDPGYPGSATVVFIDSYLIGIEPHGRFAFNSGPANALEYNTLDRFTSEVSPDALVALAVFNNKLLLLSTGSGEYFENSGASQQPFRSTRITIDKGCAGPYCVAQADNTVFFLGSDGMFYMIDGYRPVRISRRPLEQAIRGFNWSQAFAEVWEDAGFTVIYWTFPDGRTWGFNTADKEWHRRESYGINRWRMNTLTRWNDTWYAGDYQSGRIWAMDWDYVLEGDDELVSERTMAVIHDNQNMVLIPRIEFVMDTGQPETMSIPFPVQPTPPTITGAAPDGLVGIAYAGFTYTIGGTAPLGVTLVSGALPLGITVSAAGVLSVGPATQVGSFTYRLRVTDGNGLWAELTDTIAIAASMFSTQTGATDGAFITSAPYNWNTALTPGIVTANGLVTSCGGKVFICAGNLAVVSSNAGGSWTAVIGLPAGEVVQIVYSGDAWTAVMDNSVSVYRSTNGIAFSAVTMAPVASTTDSAIAIGDKIIIGRASPQVGRTSLDAGLTWADNTLFSTQQLWQFANSGTVLLNVSVANVFRSTNGGSTWSSTPGPTPTSMGGVAYGNGVFMIFDSAGNIYTSPDGITWMAKTATFAMGSIGVSNQFIFSGELFVLATINRIVTSPDGVVWTNRNNISSRSLAVYKAGQ